MQAHRHLFTLLTILFVSGESDAYAEYSYGPASFSAFGTIGGAWLSNPHVDYVQGTQPVGPGATHDFDLGLDSRLGAQLNIALTPSTLITAQAVVERLTDNSFAPRLTQANLRQEINDNLSVRIGRIQSPVFLASDYRLANFSNPWARTPGVLYSIYPLTHLDSAEFTFRHHTTLGTISLNAGYGWLEYPYPTASGAVFFPESSFSPSTNLKMDDVFFANLKLDNGPWHAKLSGLHTRATATLSALDQIVADISAIDPVTGQQIPFTRRGVGIYAAGISYEAAHWLVMGEWGIALADQPAIISDRHGGYLTIGYHFDDWLPQLTVGYQASTDRRIHSSAALVDRFMQAVHQFQRTDYRTLGVGLSYSVTDSAIVRGQMDLIEPLGNSKGPYLGSGSGYNFEDPGLDALFSLSLDFVY